VVAAFALAPAPGRFTGVEALRFSSKYTGFWPGRGGQRAGGSGCEKHLA
jgi:hypothetical protein